MANLRPLRLGKLPELRQKLQSTKFKILQTLETFSEINMCNKMQDCSKGKPASTQRQTNKQVYACSPMSAQGVQIHLYAISEFKLYSECSQTCLSVDTHTSSAGKCLSTIFSELLFISYSIFSLPLY